MPQDRDLTRLRAALVPLDEPIEHPARLPGGVPPRRGEGLEVPLRAVVDPATLAEEIWELRGAARRVSFFRHGEHKIWGATARVLGQITAILRGAEWDATILSPGSVEPWP